MSTDEARWHVFAKPESELSRLARGPASVGSARLSEEDGVFERPGPMVTNAAPDRRRADRRRFAPSSSCGDPDG